MKERADALAQNAGAQALVERQARGYLLQHVVLQLLQRRRRDQRLHVSGGHRSERRGIVKCDLQSAWSLVAAPLPCSQPRIARRRCSSASTWREVTATCADAPRVFGRRRGVHIAVDGAAAAQRRARGACGVRAAARRPCGASAKPVGQPGACSPLRRSAPVAPRFLRRAAAAAPAARRQLAGCVLQLLRRGMRRDTPGVLAIAGSGRHPWHATPSRAHARNAGLSRPRCTRCAPCPRCAAPSVCIGRPRVAAPHRRLRS